MKTHLLFLLLVPAGVAFSQDIVPNGGFETLLRCPHALGDFYPQGWWVPGANATSDLYSTCAEKGEYIHPENPDVAVAPHSGSCFAGLIAWSAESDYREYITTRLSQPLREDVEYTVEMAVAVPFFSRWKALEVEVLLSDIPPMSTRNVVIDREASVVLRLDSLKTDGTWIICKGTYTASGNEKAIAIGNFKTGRRTPRELIPRHNSKEQKKDDNHAYLCIDDVRIYPYIEEEPTAETAEEPLEARIENAAQVATVRKTIVLNNLGFASNSAVLADADIPELDALIELLTEEPGLRLIIEGHTDNTGTPEHNLQLSLERALGVAMYLSDRGILPERITTEGFGDTVPAASNESETGKALNRRVEIRVTEQ